MNNKNIIQRNQHFIDLLLRILDWGVLVLASLIVHFIYFGIKKDMPEYFQFGFMPDHYYFAVLTAFFLSAWFFPQFSLYKDTFSLTFLKEIKRVSIAWALIFVSMIGLAFVLKLSADFSRVWITSWFLLGWFLLIFIRIVFRYIRRRMFKTGFYRRRIIVVGAQDLGKEVVTRLSRSPWLGFDLVGFCCGSADIGAKVDGIQVLGNYQDVVNIVEREDIDQIWLAMPMREEDTVKEILHDLRHCTADVRFVPDIFGFRLLNHSITEVAGLPVLNLSATPMGGMNRALKEIEDKLCAFLFLFFGFPLMLFIAIGVKLSSPGPIFYRQERIGWNGQPFTMLKFRSMPVDVESKTGAVWATGGENRATPFGSFLRKTSLDELPQFINVLKGDMSIVGPRPERAVFVEQFKDEIPDYMKKHLVKAGITGWAQVNGWRGDTDLEKRIEYDLYYIEHWSLLFDIKIMLLTFFKGFVHKNAY